MLDSVTVGRAPLDAAGLDLLFRTARTTWHWTPDAVEDDTLRQLYDLLKWGPTSANCSPARFMFLRTEGAKQRLKPALSAGNVDRTLAAPVVAIVAHDPKFYEDLPRLYPGVDARAWFAGNDELSIETAFRRHGRLGLIAGRCRASTMTWLTGSSWSLRDGRATSSWRSGMATALATRTVRPG